ARRRAGGGRGIWVFGGRAAINPRGGEHGIVVRQPDGNGEFARRRDGRRSRIGRRFGRFSVGGESRTDGARYPNVEFHLATIDRLPLADNSVDCVISNCVINLAPDKSAVFREIARVLKPGGRLAVSDIALKQPLPAEIAQDVMAYVGCIAGAVQIEDYKRGLIEAGFSN